MHLIYENVNDAFQNLVHGLHTGIIPTTVRPSRVGEIMQVEEPVTVTYRSSRKRVLLNQARDANPFFHLYESLWMLAGRNDVAPLNHYLSSYGDITSDDGETANGAYGYRWRHPSVKSDKGCFICDNEGMYDGGNEMGWVPCPNSDMSCNPVCTYGRTDQLQILIDHLKSNPHSRRAVLQMWNVEDDLLKVDESKDVCCNLSVVFSVEDGTCRRCLGDGVVPIKPGLTQETCPNCGGFPHDVPRYLNITVFNRSNDMIWGMLGEDVVHFSFLQEYVACCLGLNVGSYHQITSNLHVYTERWKPEKWLAEYDPGTKTFRYDDKGTDAPLLVEDQRQFDKEVVEFVNVHAGPEGLVSAQHLSEPFLLRVAQPMCLAFHCHKERDYASALFYVEHVCAADWRTAAYNWISKRERNWKRKNRIDDAQA